MAAAEVVFDDKEIRTFFTDIRHSVYDVKNYAKEYVGLLSAIVFKDVIDHFQKEEGPEGSWKIWSDIYAKRMLASGHAGNKILQYNGRLRNNFKPQKYKTTSEGLFWFNDAKTKSGYPYAAGHNDGDGKLPRREFMWASDSAMNDIEFQTLVFLTEKGK